MISSMESSVTSLRAARIGFLGSGNMAGALMSGLLRSKSVDAAQIRASDPRSERLAELRAEHGIVTHTDNAELVAWANMIVLAVKPQTAPKVLDECGPSIGPGHLVVSIAAGLPIRAIEARVGKGTRIVRAMPNTPAIVQAGATAVSPSDTATDADLAAARALFDAVGKTVTLDEAHLDAVTGLSGSGPAYVMLFIEALADGGVRMGLPRDVALTLSTQVVYGSAKLLLDTGEHPARMREMVTSPAGTTIAGLSALEARAVRGAVMEAVEKATLRSTELGKKGA
jgi:pyrroline-5-carboxylate reductase